MLRQLPSQCSFKPTPTSDAFGSKSHPAAPPWVHRTAPLLSPQHCTAPRSTAAQPAAFAASQTFPQIPLSFREWDQAQDLRGASSLPHVLPLLPQRHTRRAQIQSPSSFSSPGVEATFAPLSLQQSFPGLLSKGSLLSAGKPNNPARATSRGSNKQQWSLLLSLLLWFHIRFPHDPSPFGRAGGWQRQSRAPLFTSAKLKSSFMSRSLKYCYTCLSPAAPQRRSRGFR